MEAQSPSNTEAAADKVRSLLGEKIKCTLDDGRSVSGTFVCIDRLTNLILTDAMEERMICSSDYSDTNDEKILTRRSLSQVMIPGERLQKVEVDQLLFDTKLRDASEDTK